MEQNIQIKMISNVAKILWVTIQLDTIQDQPLCVFQKTISLNAD